MKNQIGFCGKFMSAIGCMSVMMGAPAIAAVVDVTVDGSDAIFLAGRTDVVIPDASSPWTGPGTHLIRHVAPTPEEIKETLPPFLTVDGGDVIKVLDPADGLISFFNGFLPAPPPAFGPGGNTGPGVSTLSSLDGISGYTGPEGPLVGVFLDGSIPSAGPAPATLDFSGAGLGVDFASISPSLQQVFYIGDGVTSANVFQEFIAPAGATRLFLGIPDGFGFDGLPGAYDDNDGSYRVRIGINETPVVPLPAAAWMGMALLGGLGVTQGIRRRRLVA